MELICRGGRNTIHWKQVVVWRHHTPTYHFDNNNAIPIRIDVKLKSSTIKLVRDPIAHERKAWIGQIVTTLKRALLEKKIGT